MVIRRRRRLHRALPWLLAAGFVVTVGMVVYTAVRTDSDQIVRNATEVLDGDPANKIANNPMAALEMLERVLQREPDHFEALLQTARAWASLRNYKNAVEMLERAAQVGREGDDPTLEVKALRQGVSYLILDEDFDKGIEWARLVAELQPHNTLYTLNHGLALYNCSIAEQEILLRSFVPPGRTSTDLQLRTKDAIEAYITDLWGEPDLDALLDLLIPKKDESLRTLTSSQLLAARNRFQLAAEILGQYPNSALFDPSVALGYVELLRRSGRIYDAHIEAAMALRQPNIASFFRKAMLEAQAECLLVLGEYAGAAELYEQIVQVYKDDKAWVPPSFVFSVIENKERAEDWDWILAHHTENEKLTRNDIYVQYAHARALDATGNLEAAVEEIAQPFATVSLERRMPTSIRAFPERRRRILHLAYQLNAAVDDSDALAALDSLVKQFPNDREALETRIAVQMERERLQPAIDDAFALMTEDSRSPEDFERWLDISNELSLQQYNLTLEERAAVQIERDLELQVISGDAGIPSPWGRQAGPWNGQEGGADLRHQPYDPALAWTIVRERIPHNQLERARNDLRKLAQSHPQVQEFRLQLAKLLIRQGLLESAVGELRYILEHVPSDTEVIDFTTRIEFAVGNAEAAAELVNRMIIEDPLGVGAVRYGQLLLANGRATEANELIKRLLRWPDFKPGRDLYIMSARAFLAVGDMENAKALLISLSNQYPNNEDVALLGLETGLAAEDVSLMTSAIAHLTPMVSGLLPDQVRDLASSLLESGYYTELLTIFPENIRELPGMRPALRPLAEAAKAVGKFDEAEQLLEWLDDAESLRDRFLLLALGGHTEDAGRRLRLSTVPEEQEADRELCLMAASSMTEFQTMYDLVPVSSLRAIGLDEELDAASLELLDAVLRITPNTNRLEDVVPPEVILDPLTTYPHAGADVAALLEALEQDPNRTAETLRAVTLMLLANNRPFWWRESRFLGQQILDHVPQLTVVSRHLAQQYLDSGRPEEALHILKHLLATASADPRTLEMFLDATQAFGHGEWGLALAFESRGEAPVRLVLGETLLERGFVAEALTQFRGYLNEYPDDVRALTGVIQSYAALERPRSTVQWIKDALEAHPLDEALAHVCVESLAHLSTQDAESLQILEQLAAENPSNFSSYESLTAHYADNDMTDELTALIDVLMVQLEESPIDLWSEESGLEAVVARRVARTARSAGLNERARKLNELALQLEPGSINQFRELASLELEDGRLELARRYLEVLSIVRPYDKEAPLTLARLLFEQVGQPHVAADVIRRTYGRQLMPPDAVEVLAAEAYLRGNPGEALELFRRISHHPEVTPDTMLTVGRIAFAAGLDDDAVGIFTRFQTVASPTHPARRRVMNLVDLCEPSESSEPGAPGVVEANPEQADEPTVREQGDEAEAAASTHPIGTATDVVTDNDS